MNPKIIALKQLLADMIEADEAINALAAELREEGYVCVLEMLVTKSAEGTSTKIQSKVNPSRRLFEAADVEFLRSMRIKP